MRLTAHSPLLLALLLAAGPGPGLAAEKAAQEKAGGQKVGGPKADGKKAGASKDRSSKGTTGQPQHHAHASDPHCVKECLRREQKCNRDQACKDKRCADRCGRDYMQCSSHCGFAP